MTPPSSIGTGMKGNERVFVAALAVTLLVFLSLATYEANTSTTPSAASSSVFVTGANTGSASDTFLTGCSPSGPGLALRVVSDSTGAPISGESISAIDTFGCSIQGGEIAFQTVHLDNFSLGDGGWLSPVWPNGAVNAGTLNFTVSYQEQRYHFSAQAYLVGRSCVTLHLPSGNVTQKVTGARTCS